MQAQEMSEALGSASCSKTRVKWVFGNLYRDQKKKILDKFLLLCPLHEPSNYQVILNKSGVLLPSDAEMLLWPNSHRYFCRIIFSY